MDYKDYEDFAKQNDIKIAEVDGEFGSGYACTYIYFVPESVIKVIKELKERNDRLSKIVREHVGPDNY